ncbi:AFR629Wp [Eremothecium gossypii ATCC 10895]|uniref:Aconitate hydratase, mitochondrial n=1 Tax=Eremothecium gossypii (strain ATCC 10895 / CBS 109.51 / FGSC 9923 / NRRL Y-1056) TaxID=284811 RepID=Q752E7_EREGS|nr:AFR629Wp [Eremothecium gossypii ATCC 10895]AAS54000.2 AFR629Wp [Eremothecium gossypii ATCC 10895]AEY98314.1 FAFR629Wp [Eremothecium gossypii FDAG1]
MGPRTHVVRRWYAAGGRGGAKNGDVARKMYDRLAATLREVRGLTNSVPLTLSEKLLYAHLCEPAGSLSSARLEDIRGKVYLQLRPDRVAMQDASAQMALLQFMAAGRNQTAVPASVHCDHLVVGKDGEKADLADAVSMNNEVFDFLQSCCTKYGIQFWGPGSGIIHQVVLERFAAPGLMLLGTDSHTPNAGGLGTLAIGVGGADAVDALSGMPWELRAPRILGVKLTGQLKGWAAPKDVITKLAGLLTVRGGTGYIMEYFGSGVSTLSCTGMATICNMGAEVGVTTSLFPYGEGHRRYLAATGRSEIRDEADRALDKYGLLKADEGAEYDKLIEINLSELEPHINGPFTPDLSFPISQFGSRAADEGWPKKVSAALIGSCTNSSYEDMTKAADIIRQASRAGLKPRIPFFVSPGSEQIRATLEKDGLLDIFKSSGAKVLANACGPCIGQWDRQDVPKTSKVTNAIFTSFNRNFRARNDGNRNTMNFLTSPEIVTAVAFSGDMEFNPASGVLEAPDGKPFRFNAPIGKELPESGFTPGRMDFYPDLEQKPDPNVEVKISTQSDRLQVLEPFPAWDGNELVTMVLMRVEGKCTTDHISAAGAWLKYKGHLENISYNTLIGAQNKDTGEVNAAYDVDGKRYGIPELMMRWKEQGIPWAIVAEHNYGEGSAREHAALSPRFLGGRLILVKSFARIHETNLKKQGLLPLTLTNDDDYNLIAAHDKIQTVGLKDLIALKGNNGGYLDLKVIKPTGSSFTLRAKHTMSEIQVEFFKAGSAINYIRQRNFEES